MLPITVRSGIIVAVLALGITAGCGDKDEAEDKASGPAASTPAPTTTEVAPSAEASPVAEQAGTQLMAQALRGGQPVTCKLRHEGLPITTYVKDAAVFRVDTNAPNGKGYLLHKNGAVHVWMAGMSSGFKISTDETSPVGSGIKMFTPEEIEAMPDNDDATCKIYTGSDSVFKMPSGVQFGPLPVGPLMPVR